MPRPPPLRSWHGEQYTSKRWCPRSSVAFVTGAPFYVDGSGANTMRLTFAKESAVNIATGVARLAGVVAKACA